MAKALSKSQIAASIAEKSEISKKQATEILDHIAQLAYKHAKDTFTIPGIGKLVLRSVPSRQMVMQFGEKKGQTITFQPSAWLNSAWRRRPKKRF